MNNNSTYSNKYTPGLTVYTSITLISILLVFSLLGNVLVIVVVYCNRNLKTNFNYLIVNMAVSDLIIPLIVLPVWIAKVSRIASERHNEWLVDGPLGTALCKLVPFLGDISSIVSSFSLVVIAFNRFIAVVYPTRQILSQKTKSIQIPFTWIAAMALFSSHFYTYRLSDKSGYNQCNSSWSPAFDDDSAKMIFVSIITVVAFPIPLISIIVLYFMIQYKLKQNLNNVIGLIERRTIGSRQQTNRRIFCMSIIIVVVFMTCWSPIYVFQLLLYSKHISLNSHTIDHMYFAFSYLLCIQTAINPCIYFAYVRDFRQGLKRLCCSKTLQQNLQTTGKPFLCCSTLCTKTRVRNQDPTCTKRHINTTAV